MVSIKHKNCQRFVIPVKYEDRNTAEQFPHRSVGSNIFNCWIKWLSVEYHSGGRLKTLLFESSFLISSVPPDPICVKLSRSLWLEAQLYPHFQAFYVHAGFVHSDCSPAISVSYFSNWFCRYQWSVNTRCS